MKKSTIIAATILLLLGIAGYFSYKYVFIKEDVNILALVPRNTLLVYESDHAMEAWTKLREKEIWEDLQQLPALKKVEKDLLALDSLLPADRSMLSLFENRSFLSSMHAVSKDEFDFLYIIHLDDIEAHNVAKNLLDRIKTEQQLHYQTRNFNGFKIHELRKKGAQQVFTYLTYNDYFLASFSTILIEDVIRNINRDFADSFLQNYDLTDLVARVNNDSGSVFVNLDQLASYFSLFSNSDFDTQNLIKHFGETALLEVNLTDGLLLNGFSKAGASGENTWLQTFQGQQPQPFGIANILPDRAAIVHHMAFSSAANWLSELKQFWLATNPEQIQQWDALEAEWGIAQEDFFAILGKEVAVATLESIEVAAPDKIVYLHCNEVSRGMEVFNHLATAVASSDDNTLYTEEYAGVKIRQLHVEEFPSLLFGNLFRGFETCFYIQLDSYIIMGNSVQILKSILNDIEQEATWGKSVRYNEFLSGAISESNYNIMVNIPRVWPLLTDRLSPKWKEFTDRHSKTLKQVNLLEAQFSNIDDDYYTSLSYQLSPTDISDNPQRKLMNIHNVYTDNLIITKPYVVKNHNNNQKEVVVQDSANVLYLISSEGRILWRDSLDSRINSDVVQIDYFNNGKLQYFFTTQEGIHIVDREGNKVSGYPLKLSFSVDKAAVIDYDNSKRYRFILSDTEGNIYMYNKFGDNLEGWDPRKMDYKLSVPPKHIRVRGRDIIYAVQENGVIKMMNRKGEMYPGFPLSFDEKIKSSLFVEIGAAFAQTRLYTVTESGKVVQFTPEGKVLKKEQLYKPSASTVFMLVPETSGRDFIILRQDMRRVAILNRKGEVLFEKDYLSSEEMQAQYYYFGAENHLVVINDPVQEFTYLYDLAGNLINELPMESSHEIGLLFLEGNNQFRIYSTYNQKVSLETF